MNDDKIGGLCMLSRICLSKILIFVALLIAVVGLTAFMRFSSFFSFLRHHRESTAMRQSGKEEFVCHESAAKVKSK